MTPADRPLTEDHVSALAAAWDEALAEGVPAPPLPALQANPEMQPHLLRGLACMQVLRQVWPRQRSRAGTPTPPAAGDAPASPPPPLVAGYQILGELGRGGMGIVYKAFDPRLRRLVALKRIHSDKALPRFHTEAEAIARLQHPNIVQIYEIGEADGGPYLVLEYLAGGSLAQQLDGKPQPGRESAALIETLARAVHYAHTQGVVHRDLKPANILLSFSREPPASAPAALAGGSRLDEVVPKVADFGLAKRLNEGPGPTQHGDILGTPSYMAPEQASGCVQQIGPATDVYCLGVILYELLTGRTPFIGSGPLETLMLIRTVEPVPPRRLQPSLPRDLETICLKCLEKEPTKRYTSAWELAEDLRRFQVGESIRARPVGLGERSLKWVRRHPAAAALIAVTAVSVFLLLVSAVAWSYNQRLEGAYREADRQRALAEDLRLRVQYLHDMQRMQQSWDSTADIETIQNLCERWGTIPPGLSDPRGWELSFVRGLLNSGLQTIRSDQGRLQCLAYSPDGRWLASGGSGKTVDVREAATGHRAHCLRGHTYFVAGVAFRPDSKQLASIDLAGAVWLWDLERGGAGELLCPPEQGKVEWAWTRGLVWCPDGRHVLVDGRDKIQLWDLVGRRVVRTFSGPGYDCTSLAVSRDGRQMAAAGYDKPIHLWDLAGGRLLHTLAGHASGGGAVAFGPDGRVLATGTYRGDTVRLWDTATGKVLHEQHSGGAHVLAFSPDGRRLAIAYNNRLVCLQDLGGGPEKAWTFKGHTEPVWGVAFRPDGKVLVSAGEDGTLRLWDTVEGHPEWRRLTGHKGSVPWLAFSPRGGLLVSAGKDGTVRLWDPRGRRQLHALTGHATEHPTLAIHPDGQRLAAVSPDGSIKFWDLTDGKELGCLRGSPAIPTALAFSADGAQLVSGHDNGLLRFWDVRTGQPVREWKGHWEDTWVSRVALRRDGRQLASAANGDAIKLWDVASGREVLAHTLKMSRLDGPTGIAFSPDGERFAAGVSWRGVIKIWNTATGKASHELHGHVSAVNALVFIGPGGNRLASAGLDKMVKLWDWQLGMETLTRRGTETPVASVAFSPDGRQIAIGDLDGTIGLLEVGDESPAGSPAP
jgi:WD40 repeat protein/tRNA A-37 threonylcarbamoyl transferase component Bud32